MPATIHIVNRYVNSDNVAGAAVVFDGAAIDAKSPRTRANGQVVVATETLSDGNHVMNIVPDHTSADPVGPAVAEGLGKTVTRMYRSLDVNVTVSKGKITALSVALDQALDGVVLAGVNPVRVQLQPVYYRSQYQKENFRQGTDITLIVVHQTAKAANIAGTLGQFTIPNLGDDGTSSHYVISPEAIPQVVKVVQDTGSASHAGTSSWQGKNSVNDFSIGIELSHKTGTPFPAKQIDCLIDLIGRLRAAYPTIPADGVVGHSDVLMERNDPSILAGRDCPGFDFDWARLEKRGLGLIPARSARARYVRRFLPGGDGPAQFARCGRLGPCRGTGAAKSGPHLAAAGRRRPSARRRRAARQPRAADRTGAPIAELQTDLGAVGYLVAVNGITTTRRARPSRCSNTTSSPAPGGILIHDKNGMRSTG